MATVKENIQQIIEELASAFADMNEENFPTEGEEFTTEAAENIQELAKGYWDERNEQEIKRDEEAGVDMEDYAIWCGEGVYSRIFS